MQKLNKLDRVTLRGIGRFIGEQVGDIRLTPFILGMIPGVGTLVFVPAAEIDGGDGVKSVALGHCATIILFGLVWLMGGFG